MGDNHKNNYLNPAWRALLQHNDLNDFDQLWNLEHEWFEEPNRRRGGWSGVCRLELQGEDGRLVPVFLKRQENHRARTLNHPFTGIPTARRELQNLLAFKENGLPVPEILYGADRICRGQVQGILLTRELTGYQSLDEILFLWQSLELPDSVLADALLPPLAAIIGKMHRLGFRHNCLYGKHIFARSNYPFSQLSEEMVAAHELVFSVCFIDLEKARRSQWMRRNIIRDLSQLERHTTFSTALWQQFLNCYLASLPQSGNLRAALDQRSRHRQGK